MAKSSRFLRIDDDVLLEFIYHDQSNPQLVAIENDNNGSQLKYINTVDQDSSESRFLIHELGADVVEFTIETANGYIAINNFASRQLLLKNGKTYKFDLSDPSIDNINGFNIPGGNGSLNVADSIYTYIPLTNGKFKYEYTDTASTVYIGGEIEVSNRASSLFSVPLSETGNDVKTAPGESGRYYAVPTSITGTMALIDNTFDYLDSVEWNGTPNPLTVVNTSTVDTVWYDTIKLHLRTGYSFSGRGYDGFLFQTKARRNSGVYNYFNSTVYLNSSNYEYQNPNPFILGETSYSKYIEIKVPTLVSMDSPVLNGEFHDSFFGSTGSADAMDISANYEIDFKLISKTFNDNGYNYINVVEGKSVILSNEDEYTDLTVSVEHDADGDFFNIYGTKDGSQSGFESYINGRMQTSGDDLTIFYEVQVAEQIGLNYISTFSNTFTQTSQFDEAIVFRPVIMNSSISSNFSIKVNMRIYNETDNTQILKTASLIYSQPKKYGKKLLKLNLNSNFNPMVVYNTLPSTSANVELNQYVNSVRPSIGETKYVPVALDTYGIVASNTKVTTDGADISSTSTLKYHKEGTGIITLAKVSDNFIKFKVAKNGDGVLNAVSLVNAEDIILIIKSGDILESISHDPSFPGVDMGAGEILFKIPKSTAIRFDQYQTNQYTDKFYINIKNGNTESMLYYGKVNII